MLIAASKLVHLPVIEPDTYERLGVVVRPVFDADKGTLIALQIKKSGLMREKKFITAVDIHAYENHAILAREDALADLIDLPRIREALLSRRPVLNQPAQTVTKHHLGKVAEVLFDDASNIIMQFHTHLLFKNRIFKYEDVVKITPRAVLFKDDLLKVHQENTVASAPSIAFPHAPYSD